MVVGVGNRDSVSKAHALSARYIKSERVTTKRDDWLGEAEPRQAGSQ